MAGRRYALACIIMGGLLSSCGGSKESSAPAVDSATRAEVVASTGGLARIPANGSIKDTIEFIINDAMIRLRQGDKTGMYENELRYWTDEHTVDEYLKAAEISRAKEESLAFVTVLNVEKVPVDSARVEVDVFFDSKAGGHSKLRDTIIMYYSDGRWRRPRISRFADQLEYEKLIRQAEEDAGG